MVKDYSLFEEDDIQSGVPFPEISIEFGGTEPLRSSPVGSGIEPPTPEEEDPHLPFWRNVSSVYNRLAPSDESMADLQAVQNKNQEIADELGMTVKELQQRLAYGDKTAQFIKDKGFQLYTPSQDFTRVRDFLYGAQKKAYEKKASGVPHSDLPFDEKIASFMGPIDVFDWAGVGIGVKALIKLGVKKFGGMAGKKSVIDFFEDKELVGSLSDSEMNSLFQDMKPLMQGDERDAFLRYAKGKPTKKKTAGILTAKDEILGLGDDLRAPKQIMDSPTLKTETQPVKTAGVEGPVTIDDILESTQRDIAGKKMFEGRTVKEFIRKGDSSVPEDPYLTPDKPLSVEEIKSNNKKINKFNPAQFNTYQQLPRFGAGEINKLNPQRQKILKNFVSIMKSEDPFKIASV